MKLDLPEWELSLESGSPRTLEIFDEDTAEWRSGTVDRWAMDGRTLVSFTDAGVSQWLDLTKCRYRWVVNTPQLADGVMGAGDDGRGGEP